MEDNKNNEISVKNSVENKEPKLDYEKLSTYKNTFKEIPDSIEYLKALEEVNYWNIHDGLL